MVIISLIQRVEQFDCTAIGLTRVRECNFRTKQQLHFLLLHGTRKKLYVAIDLEVVLKYVYLNMKLKVNMSMKI